MAAAQNDNTPRKAGLRALLRRPHVVAPVGAGIVVATGFALSHLRPPPAPPVTPIPIHQTLAPAGTPARVGPPTTGTPGVGMPEPSPAAPGGRRSILDIEIDMRASSSVAGRWFDQAAAEPRLLCRAATFCAALDAYETVIELADNIDSCGNTCAALEARATTRVAYIKSRIPQLANSAGCAAAVEPCACVGLLAGAQCQP